MSRSYVMEVRGNDVIIIPAGTRFQSVCPATTFTTTKRYPRWWQRLWRLLPWVDKSRLTIRVVEGLGHR